jgi:hypothetical protein
LMVILKMIVKKNMVKLIFHLIFFGMKATSLNLLFHSI